MRNLPPQRAKSLGCEHLGAVLRICFELPGTGFIGQKAMRHRSPSQGKARFPRPAHACGMWGLIRSIRQGIAPLTATEAWIMLEATCQ